MGHFADLTVVELSFGPTPGDFWHDTVVHTISDEVFVAWERTYDQPGYLEFGLGTLRVYPQMPQRDEMPRIDTVRSSGLYQRGQITSSDYAHGRYQLTHVVFPPHCVACYLDPFEPSDAQVYVARHEQLSRLSATFVAREKVVLSLSVRHDPGQWYEISPERMFEPPYMDMNPRRNVNWFFKWATGLVKLPW